MQNIRELENDLFKEWREYYKEQSFVIDGCPNPEKYLQQKRKVVFVLKDGNLGEPNLSRPIEERTYDQRKEIEEQPTLWWKKIARWAYFIQENGCSWSDVERIVSDEKSICDVLGCHCIVQLKKTWGGGSVENDSLLQTIEKDKERIRGQLSIYEPDFIIACGNGESLRKVFGLEPEFRMSTTDGVGFWKFDFDNKFCTLVDYCHPSIRVGSKVSGIIAKGLSNAILEIENT